MKNLKRQNFFLTLIFTLIFVVAFSMSGYAEPPTCDANGPYVECPGEIITLDGSGSYAAGSSILTLYEWDFNNDGIYDASGVSETVDWSFTNDGQVGLRVTDESGTTDTCSAAVTVDDTTPP